MPSEKRSRQRAGREARMAELRRAQKRRHNLRLGLIGGGILVVVVALIIITSSGGGSSKTKTAAAPGNGVLTAAAAAALTPVAPPAISPACTTPAPPTTGATTTVPAKGNAVAVIDAPAGVPFPTLKGEKAHYTKFTAAPPFCINVAMDYTAVIQTDVGTIKIQLLPADAPVTVNNFVFLAGYHYFDGTVFQRVIPGFIDQGGDPTGTGTGNPGYQFNDELPKAAAAYDAGAVAMANSGANTNGSQFFMVVGTGGARLAPSYSMFGQVTSGINVMNEINAGGTSSGTPKKLHHIVSVTITETPPPPPPATTTATTAPATTTSTTVPATTTTTPPASTTPSSGTTASTAGSPPSS